MKQNSLLMLIMIASSLPMIGAVPPVSAFDLQLAAANGDLNRVDKLIKSGVNVNAVGPFGFTALFYAAHNGKATVVKRLIEAGANPNALTVPTRETPLMAAAKNGFYSVVRELLRGGINARDARGYTALMLAAINGHGEVIEALIKAGARLDLKSNEGHTALDLALIHRQNNVAQLLNIERLRRHPVIPLQRRKQ